MTLPQDPQSTSAPEGSASASERSAGSFIVNLCALPRPAIPEHLPVDLEGLRPFLSRRTKDGVHRFYLHVGFFASLAEAEAWLGRARTTYPNSFVSEIADTLRPSEPGTPPIADTQTTRVLEARERPHIDVGTETGSYAIPLDARVLTKPPTAPKAVDAWSEVLAERNSGSSSGVRHLRVEIQRRRDQSRKPPKTRK